MIFGNNFKGGFIMTKRYKRSDVTQELVLVASGVKKADLVIKNAKLINVNTAEIIPQMDVAVTKGRIALVGDATHTIGPNTKCIDATGLYLAPGFIDGHIHVESSMLTVKEYAKAVMPHGTTTIMMDPHEIANVLGTEGIGLMIQEGKEVPLNVYTTMPSCVPATADLETTGASLSLRDIAHGLSQDTIIGLGEMMNYPAVLSGDSNVHGILKATLDRHKTITGHYCVPDEGGPGLNAYIAAGANCCHETTRHEDALAKMRLGMYVQIREGSAWCDVKETIKAITEHQVDSRFACLVSDDTHPDTLLSVGHMDYIIRRAIEEGVRPVVAIQMATINAAECFGLAHDLGSVSPGKWADLVLLSDLTKVTVAKTIINGEVVAENGQLTITLPPASYPEFAKHTMNIYEALTAEDFKIAVPHDYTKSTIPVHAIGIIEAQAGTIHKKGMLTVKDGFVSSDVSADLLKVAVIDRHSGTQSMSMSFVTGFGIQDGAVASTVAHDAHNLCIIGTNDEDMALAANTLVTTGGGQVVVQNGKVLALNPLPIAGLMSEDSAAVVAQRVSEIDEAWKTIGCPLHSPFMTMALLSLAVIPELRLTNKGLVDTVNFKTLPIFDL